MADFNQAYEKTMAHEGGYVNDPDDRGGETYKGIARKFNSKWEGWSIIDIARTKGNFPRSLDSDQRLQDMIKRFYETGYWDSILGDQINSQLVAEAIFDFGVNAGVASSSKLAQAVADVKADGVIGAKSIEAINKLDEKQFITSFTLAKIARYVHLCEKRTENRKFFFGWVRRALGGVA